MTQDLTLHTDAVTRGELVFAIVRSFNARDMLNLGIDLGNDSGDMTGILRLMNGEELAFAYVDGRFPIRDPDGLIRWDQEGYSPAWGGYGMGWPHTGAVLMVEVVEGRVLHWTWPGAILSNPYRISDSRYLVPPSDQGDVQFRGLHCVVDLSQLEPGQVEDLRAGPCHDFPRAVYVGHEADAYLAAAPDLPNRAVFAWDPELGKSRCVSWVTLS